MWCVVYSIMVIWHAMVKGMLGQRACADSWQQRCCLIWAAPHHPEARPNRLLSENVRLPMTLRGEPPFDDNRLVGVSSPPPVAPALVLANLALPKFSRLPSLPVAPVP